MKKLFLMGRSEAGKTSLTQALKGEELHYVKTQYTTTDDNTIDSPGEYAESKRFSVGLACFSFEADVVADLKPGDVYTLPACGNEGMSINRVESIEIVDGKAVIVNDTSFEQEEALSYVEELNVEETAEVNMDNVTGIYDEA